MLHNNTTNTNRTTTIITIPTNCTQQLLTHKNHMATINPTNTIGIRRHNKKVGYCVEEQAWGNNNKACVWWQVGNKHTTTQ